MDGTIGVTSVTVLWNANWRLILTFSRSFACALALGAMDKRAEKLVREPLKEKELKKSKKKKEEKEVMKPTDIFRFPPTFWLLSIICLAYYAAIFPFISLGQVFFMKKFMFNKSEANMINGRASQSISTKYYVVVAF